MDFRTYLQNNLVILDGGMGTLLQAAGLEAGELVHVIADCHIYDRHIPIVEELIKRTPFDAPKVTLDPSVDNFYDFTPDSFTVENYVHGEKIGRFPVAV